MDISIPIHMPNFSGFRCWCHYDEVPVIVVMFLCLGVIIVVGVVDVVVAAIVVVDRCRFCCRSCSFGLKN